MQTTAAFTATTISSICVIFLIQILLSFCPFISNNSGQHSTSNAEQFQRPQSASSVNNDYQNGSALQQATGINSFQQPIWQCPNNGTYFDTTPCDPSAHFSCAVNYKCRMAVQQQEQQQWAERLNGNANNNNKLHAGQPVRFLCCETTGMGIRKWLLETGLAPAVFPQLPNITLRRVVLRDVGGRVAMVEGNGADVSMLGGGSGDTGFSNFSLLESVEFQPGEVPLAGGFLHVLEAINQLNSVSALRLHFDYPSFGAAELNLREHNERFPRGFVQATGSGFMPWNDFYRRQQVVLVFHTVFPLANRTLEIERWMNSSDGKFHKLMWDNGSGMPALLGDGVPIAGFIFNLTSRGNLFPVSFTEKERYGVGEEEQQSNIQEPTTTTTTVYSSNSINSDGEGNGQEQGQQAVRIGQLSHNPGLVADNDGNGKEVGRLNGTTIGVETSDGKRRNDSLITMVPIMLLALITTLIFLI